MERYTEEDADKVVKHLYGTISDTMSFFVNMEIAGKLTPVYKEILNNVTEWESILDSYFYDPGEEEREMREYEKEQDKAFEGMHAARLAGLSDDTIHKMMMEDVMRESKEMDKLWDEIAKTSPTEGWPLDYI